MSANESTQDKNSTQEKDRTQEKDNTHKKRKKETQEMSQEMGPEMKLQMEILNVLFEGAFIVSEMGTILHWNQGAKRLTGYSAEDMVMTNFSEDILNLMDDVGRQLCLGNCPVELTFSDGVQREVDAYTKHKRGHRVPLKYRVSMLEVLPNGEKSVLVTMAPVMEAVKTSERLNAESQLLLMDTLTDLPNRTYIDLILDEKIKMYERFSFHFGVALVDIDNFEGVNATFGRALSDEVLSVLARTFRNSFRGADFIGRWQNDEFLFFFSGVTNEHMQKLCERIRILAEGSVLRNETFRDIEFTVSVGGTVIRKGDTQQSVMDRVADRLKRAKSKGGNTCMTR